MEERKFMKGDVRVGIRFTVEDMLEGYVEEAKNNESIKLQEHFQVIDGPFTYYAAYPEYKDEKIDVFEDIGWGCAWRSSLNIINKLKEWLQSRNLNVKADVPSILTMSDIKEWKEHWEAGLWIEPADNAELILEFIDRCYTKEDAERIHELVGFRGRLYLKDQQLNCSQHQLIDSKFSFLKSIAKKQKKRSSLQMLRQYLLQSSSSMNHPRGENGGDNNDGDNMTAIMNTISQKIELNVKNNDDINEGKTEYIIITDDDDDDDEEEEVWSDDEKEVLKTLMLFYDDAYCFDGSQITIHNFPSFDSDRAAFPLNIDDLIYARNVYGRNFDAEGNVCNLFIGEVHVWEELSPWVISGWRSVADYFQNKNVMMLEVFVK